jgi:2-C-methyl-D-erythritol 2,4-cyclodiphosphate synthase
MTSFRIGTGYDIHRLKRGRALWLGGVRIDSPKGLDGHSDADVLLHAITDALLGAAALPDIGHYFPPGDPAIKNIASARMLAKAVQEIKKAGYRVGNVDATVVAEAPKLAPHRLLMRRAIAKILQVPVGAVQVKGKTNEGLDAVGRGQAIAAQAVVLLEALR